MALIFCQRWELKQSLFDRAIIIDMYGVFEHVIYEVGVGFYKVIENLQHLEVLLLPLKECAKSHIIGVEFDSRYGLKKFLSVSDDGLISFFDLLLLFL